jgi:hypothetical protein
MPRAPHQREPGYEDLFDFSTVAYDCFRSADRRSVIIITAPTYELQPIVLQTIAMGFGVEPTRLASRRMKLQEQIRVRTDKAIASFNSPLFGRRTLMVQPNRSSLFAKKRVLLTKSKNNELAWIRDWVHFYAAKHKTDAVLFYENASTKYDIAEVERTIAGVPGIDTVAVVEWPFKYGPPSGPQGIWDSNFSDMAILEHARHRFLPLAHSVICTDIDELIITADGSSLHDNAARSQTGYLEYVGHWVENAAAELPDIPRHRDFFYRAMQPEKPVEPKYTVVPARCPDHAQWMVHAVTDMTADAELSSLASLRHFKGISTNWRMQRKTGELPDLTTHHVDDELVEWMRIFEP